MNKFIENVIGIIISTAIVGVMIFNIYLVSKTDWAINIKDVVVFVIWFVTVIVIALLWTDWDK